MFDYKFLEMLKIYYMFRTPNKGFTSYGKEYEEQYILNYFEKNPHFGKIYKSSNTLGGYHQICSEFFRYYDGWYYSYYKK